MRGVILDAETSGTTSLAPILAIPGDWEVFQRSSKAEVVERIKEADVIVSNKALVTAEALAGARQLKLVAVLATGTNNVDLEATALHGVPVCNARAYAGASVAQHTMALMLNLATNIPGYCKDVVDGIWTKRQTFALVHRPIFELQGKTLGIVGYGDLGQAVARLAKAFGMQVLISARPGSEIIETNRTPFLDLLAEVDVLSLHCPLFDDNKHLINMDTLSRMKQGALLINTARGGLIDSLALLEALNSGHLGGAGLDTLEVEPPPADDILIAAAANLDNLIITPHSAWGALESRDRLVQQVADNITANLAGRAQNVVSA